MNNIAVIFSFYMIINAHSCLIPLAPVRYNDVYNYCSNGDTLSLDLFYKSKRIIKNENWFLILIDLHAGQTEYSYTSHLLFCDSNFVLKAASGGIDEILGIKGDTIFCILSDNYYLYKSQAIKPYRYDLPKEISIKSNNRGTNWNGYQRESLAIIDSLIFDKKSEKVVFHLRMSESVFFPGRSEYFSDLNYYNEAFYITKRMEYPLSLLHFDSENEFVYVVQENNMRSEFHTLNDSVLLCVKKDIWASFLK